jgi:hypothetical protein
MSAAGVVGILVAEHGLTAQCVDEGCSACDVTMVSQGKDMPGSK